MASSSDLCARRATRIPRTSRQTTSRRLTLTNVRDGHTLRGLRFACAREVLGDRHPARGRRDRDGPVPLFVRSRLLRRSLRRRVLQVRGRIECGTHDRGHVYLPGRSLADAELRESCPVATARRHTLLEVSRAGFEDLLVWSAHHAL